MLIRKDLTPSQQAVQACHAVIEAHTAFNFSQLSVHPHLVLLEVADLPALERAKNRLQSRNIPFKEFIEPDLNHEVTALCTPPLHGAARRVLRGFPLLNLEVFNVCEA